MLSGQSPGCVFVSKKILDINLRSRIKSSVPIYLRLGLVTCDQLCQGASLPNMMKNGDSFEFWFGKLVVGNAVASGTTLSHSMCLKMCFARQLLRNLWNPSDEYHLIVVCMEVNRFSFQLQALLQPWKINHLKIPVPLSISSFLQTPNGKAM